MAYNNAGIRELLIRAFNDEELMIFCFDHYRAVYDKFSTGMSRIWKIQLLIEHCESSNRLDMLLAEIDDMHPELYAQYDFKIKNRSQTPEPSQLPDLPPTTHPSPLFTPISSSDVDEEQDKQPIITAPAPIIVPRPPDIKFPPPANSTGRLAINQQAFLTINKAAFFKEQKPCKAGEVTVVPLLPHKEVNLELFSSAAKFHKATVQLDAARGLAIWSWRNKGKVINTKINRNVSDWLPTQRQWQFDSLDGERKFQVSGWPSPDHSWQFETLDLERGYLLNDQVIKRFMPKVIQAGWLIWHQATNQGPETFLILLGKVT